MHLVQKTVFPQACFIFVGCSGQTREQLNFISNIQKLSIKFGHDLFCLTAPAAFQWGIERNLNITIQKKKSCGKLKLWKTSNILLEGFYILMRCFFQTYCIELDYCGNTSSLLSISWRDIYTAFSQFIFKKKMMPYNWTEEGQNIFNKQSQRKTAKITEQKQTRFYKNYVLHKLWDFLWNNILRELRLLHITTPTRKTIKLSLHCWFFLKNMSFVLRKL